jgi:hypothetical protein
MNEAGSRVRRGRTTSASVWRSSSRKSSRRVLRLKYHNSLADAMADLGEPHEIGRIFSDFEKYLYQPQALGMTGNL